jgi:hypothetical protein
MRVTLDLPDDVVDRMQREADRRAMSLDALVSEWAYQLPEALTEAATGEVGRLGFFALGSSTNGGAMPSMPMRCWLKVSAETDGRATS